METGKEIIEFTKGILNNVAKLDDIIDATIEPIKDYTDTIGDIITPFRSLVAISNLKRRMTFKAFIKNYAQELENHFEITKEETIRLEEFFKSKKNIQSVAEIIDSAINSKSLKSSAILGIIAGKFLKEKTDLNFEYLSLIESLNVMTDIDLFNFIELYEYIENSKLNDNSEDKEYRTRDFYKKDDLNKIKLDKDSLELTIEKLKRTNGLTYGIGGIGSVGNARGAFEMNSVTRMLYSIIKKTKIVE